MGAAVKADAAAVVESVGAGGDVDKADCAQAEFGRQRAGDQRHTPDQAGFENAAEAGDAVGEHDPVDTELHIGVIVADVEQAAGRRILRDAWRLQQHLFDRAGGPLRQRVDGFVTDYIRCRADGRVEIAARRIEGVRLGGEFFGRRSGRRRCRPMRHRLRFGRLRLRPPHHQLRQRHLRARRFAKADKRQQCRAAKEARARMAGAICAPDRICALDTNRHDVPYAARKWPSGRPKGGRAGAAHRKVSEMLRLPL